MGPLHTHEMLKTSKHPVVLYAVLVAAVGALTQCGVVPEWVATFNALFSGFHFYLNPQDSLACGRDVDIPWRRVVATPRPRRGYSVERRHSHGG